MTNIYALRKNLTFRVKLVPDKVYAKGITERECLDSLEGINHPSEMCWRLIYRKLKGNRGCTSITDFEYNKIMEKLDTKNDLDGNNFDYSKTKNEIIGISDGIEYEGIKAPIDIKNRLLYEKGRGNSYESHFQAYILQNIENNENINFEKLKENGIDEII